MKTLGYDQPLYILPFDHRGSFVTKMFGWYGRLTPAQTAEIAGGCRNCAALSAVRRNL
jgi:hypothetical protein